MALSSSQRESIASNATGSSWAGTEAGLTFSTTSSFYEKRGGTLTRLEVEVGILGGVDDSFLDDIEGRSSPHSQSFPSTPSDASFMSIPGRESTETDEAITPVIHSSEPVLPDNLSAASKKGKKSKKQYQTVPIVNGSNLFVGNRFVGFNKTSLSLFDELLAHEEIETIVENTKSRKQKQKEVKSNAVAGKNTLPSATALEAALRCGVYSEAGRYLEFEQILRKNHSGPTVVVFVRHMWCGLCQEFLKALAKVDKKCYTAEGVEVVVIGCGDPALIRKYKETSKFEGRMYSDPSGELQERLGMTMRTLDPGSNAEKGDYQQMSLLKNGLVSAANGLKMLGRNPGRFDRLGGEFVFDVDEDTDDVLCYYAHRMTNTRSHGPIEKLFLAAGVQTVFKRSTGVSTVPLAPSVTLPQSIPTSYSDDTVRNIALEPESCPL